MERASTRRQPAPPSDDSASPGLTAWRHDVATLPSGRLPMRAMRRPHAESAVAILTVVEPLDGGAYAQRHPLLAREHSPGPPAASERVRRVRGTASNAAKQAPASGCLDCVDCSTSRARDRAIDIRTAGQKRHRPQQAAGNRCTSSQLAETDAIYRLTHLFLLINILQDA